MTTSLREQLIGQLRAEGHGKTADKLDFMIHKVAWTTGSELEQEFNSAIQTFRQTKPALSPKLEQILSDMGFV